MKTHSFAVAVLIYLVAQLIPASALGQQEQTTGKPSPTAKIDPKADAVLRDLAAHVKKVQSLSYEMQISLNVEAGGKKTAMNLTYEIAMERPNKFAMSARRDEGPASAMAPSVMSDGTNLFTYVPALKKYTKTPAPKNLDGISSKGGAANMMGANAGFTDALFGSDPYKGMIEGVETGTYIGVDKIGGKEAHHLKFTQPQFDWDLWIQSGEEPRVVKLVPDMTKLFAQSNLPDNVRNAKMETTMLFNNWKADAPVPPARFQFTPPEGAELVESFQPKREENPLLGKAAPDFKLELLNGGNMNLAQHKGKEVVILDFWATWCGPCMKALPSLIEVADTYKSKDVVFYAINQREKPETITKSLEKNGWKMAVPLDTDGAVGNAYHVRGIPQTVIIGKDGTVQVVHVGFAPDLKSKISAELDALLAGEDLAAKGAAGKKEKK